MLIVENRSLGAIPTDDGKCTFCVWAPLVNTVEVVSADGLRRVTMDSRSDGYFQVTTDQFAIGDRYFYRLDDEVQRPDPASTLQPEGVHGPSQVTAREFNWQSPHWYNLALEDYVLYELHVGTFTPEGTFDGVIPHLERLREFGITAISVMPIAQFPGRHNWGYDGVQLFAAQNSYGGPEGFKRLVDACHLRGMAVILDVVYNHLGPEGNYLHGFGPYFTRRYSGSWGESLNFDGAHCDEVRRFFFENGIYWLDECRVDGFRLDATHALYDLSPVTFLEEFAAVMHHWAHRHGRRVHLIAENDASNVKLTRARGEGGFGVDAQWLDDLHHVLHVHLTGESQGYYSDYDDFRLLVKCLREGFVYSGQYSKFQQRRLGTSAAGVPGYKFVVASQTHDQVGNRKDGDRLSTLVDLDSLKLAAGTVLLSGYIPMLFMGEEYGETAPFLYFADHSDPQLIEGVRKGRVEEFAYFAWQGEPPDPFAESTFEKCILHHEKRLAGDHKLMYEFYGELLSLRRRYASLRQMERKYQRYWDNARDQTMVMLRTGHTESCLIVMNFHLHQPATITLPPLGAAWTKVFDSSTARWQSGTRWQPAESRTATIPEQIQTSEISSLELPEKSFVVYITSLTNKELSP